MSREEKIFTADDEARFKKDFVIQFLASHDAVNFSFNCSRGWEHHKPAVEDARNLADRAWDEWVETIGLRGTDESLQTS